MPRAITRAFFPSLISGLLLGLSFPPFNQTYLAWIALVPLLSLPSARPLQNFWSGLLTGTIANLFIFFWMWKTFNTAHVSVFTTGPVWLALSLLLAIYVGVFNAGLGALQLGGFRIWIGAALWVALEFIKSIILTGFPWALLAHTQAFHHSLIQIASITGAEGVSFLIVVANISIAQLIHEKFSFVSLRQFGYGVLLIGAVLFWGKLRATSIQNLPVKQEVRVAVLQGNIDQYQKWDQAYEAGIRKVYSEMANTAVLGQPKVIIWPESSVPGWYPNNKFYVDWVAGISTGTKTTQLIGAVSARQGRDTNSAFLVGPDGTMKFHYDKIHLVPFGEYIPFGGIFRKVIPYLGQLGSFSPGTEPSIFQLDNLKFAPNICYEAVFPNLVRKSVQAGGDVIVNLTNDGWYLDTGAPMQHYVTNIYRAVENGRPVVRAANTGISAAIDSTGHEIFRSNLNERGIYFADIKIPELSFSTFFNEWGSWFSTFCLAFSVFVYSALCLVNLNSKSKN